MSKLKRSIGFQRERYEFGSGEALGECVKFMSRLFRFVNVHLLSGTATQSLSGCTLIKSRSLVTSVKFSFKGAKFN